MRVFDNGEDTIALFAETRRSGPMVFCKSPSASISANRALARASPCAIVCELLRNEMAERLSNPTAITVNRIISASVTTKANPLSLSFGDTSVFIIGYCKSRGRRMTMSMHNVCR